MGTDDVMRKTLELARLQLANYKSLSTVKQQKTQQQESGQTAAKTLSASQKKKQAA